MTCMADPVEISGIFGDSNDIPNYDKLWFDTKYTENFEQFYRHMTGNELYSISSVRVDTNGTNKESNIMSSIVHLIQDAPRVG